MQMEKYCDAANAQDAYEKGLSIVEDNELDKLRNAEYVEVDQSDLSFDLCDAAPELLALIKRRDDGELGLAALGQAVMNIRNAYRQRTCGVFAAPDPDEAVRLAGRGEAV